MYYELLNAGDRVLTITTEFLAVERNNGQVEMYPLSMKGKKVWLDTESVTVIGYSSDSNSEDIDEYSTSNGVQIVNF